MSRKRRRRLVAHLTSVFFLMVGWPLADAVAEQRAERVVVLEPAAASTDAHRSLTRVREELAAGGFDVETLDPGPRTDPVSIAEDMKNQSGAIAVVALIGDPATRSAELWVFDRIRAQGQIHRIPEPIGDSQQVPEVLAIRTIEVLRASALEQLVESSRPPAPPAAPRAPVTPPPAAPRAPITPPPAPKDASVAASRGFGVETGLASVESRGGPGTAFLPVIGLRVQLGRVIFLRLGVAALGSRPTVATSIGSVSVSQAFGLLEVGLAFRPGRRLQPLVTGGAGVLRVDVDGQGVPPFLGVGAGRFAAMFDAGIGLAARIAPHLALVAEAQAFAAFPYPTIRFVDTTVSTLGRPGFAQVLSLVVWP